MSNSVASPSVNTPNRSGGPFAHKKASKKPKYSRFTQQELPACKPLLTPGWVIGILMVVGVICIPLGAIALHASKNVVEVVNQYETICIPNAFTKEERLQHIQDATSDKSCIRSLLVPKKMKSPVYVYYQLNNYYQNHRRYVKNRSDKQLMDGESASNSDLDSCKPEKFLNGNPIIPCGLIAWSLFNDTYSFQIKNKGSLSVNKHGISWKRDRDRRFGSNVFPKNFPNNFRENGSIIGGAMLDENKPLNEDEDLIVWMRTAALPTFRKLWGKIETDLEMGDLITVNITNVYNTYSFHGHKKLVLSTTSWLGGKNHFLGISYLTIGGVSILLAFFFFIVHFKSPRPLGDPDYLSWNRKSNNAAVVASR